MKKDNKIFVGITVVLCLMIFFCVSMTVSSNGKGATSEKAAYCHYLEKDYEAQARAIMNENGYWNSGITMTRISNADGTREYTVALHHERLTKASTEQKSELFDSLRTIEFDDGEVHFEVI